MKVAKWRRLVAQLHAILDDLAPGHAQVVLLQIDAVNPRNLLVLAHSAHVVLRSLNARKASTPKRVPPAAGTSVGAATMSSFQRIPMIGPEPDGWNRGSRPSSTLVEPLVTLRPPPRPVPRRRPGS